MPYNLTGGTNTIRESFLPREVLVLLTVLFAFLSCLQNRTGNKWSDLACHSKVIAPLGRMSLSVFLWHQPLFAFCRYFFADELSADVLICLIVVVFLLSVFTYYFIEKRITISKVSRLYLILSFVIVNVFALWIYQKGGVVRDIPELDIREGETDPMFLEQYTDRIYQYDHEFTQDNTKQKILVIGNSFARDFANILLESSVADSIQLSYHYVFESCPLNRIRQCDRIYFFVWKHEVPEMVWQNLSPHAEIWGIGTKNHGTGNGIFYKYRYQKNYYAQRTVIKDEYHHVNRLLRDEWQSHYVDLLSFTLQPDSTVPVFTPDHHFITYDGRHLTPERRFYLSHQRSLMLHR